jgi:putative ABC transport system substrate-binding protein
MPNRRAFLYGATAAALALPLATGAQQAKRVPRVGILVHGTPAAAEAGLRVLRDALRDLGYIEPETILLELRGAETQDLLPQRAAELVRVNPDVILTPGTAPTQAVVRATTTIPIVMVGAGDPVQSGLITSLARPGGNVTGTADLSPELSRKQLELLKDALSRVPRVAVLWNARSAALPAMLREVEAAADTIGVRVQFHAVRAAHELDRVFSDISTDHPDALLVFSDPWMFLQLGTVADLALKRRLPAIYEYRQFAMAGGLMSYGPSLPVLLKRSAVYIDKLLKGAKPADLPVEQPTKFELVINLKTAKTLGLTVPPSLLGRADEVIE